MSPMSRLPVRAIVIIAVIVGIGIGVGGVSVAVVILRGRTFDIRISQQRIQRSLDGAFPITKTYSVGPIGVSMVCQNPRVDLEEGSDRVGAGMDLIVTPQVSDSQVGVFYASGYATFEIDFDPKTGELFLTDMKFEQLDLAGVPDRYGFIVRRVATMIAKEVLKHAPVYQLTAKDTKTTIAKLILKGVTVRDGMLVVTLGI